MASGRAEVLVVQDDEVDLYKTIIDNMAESVCLVKASDATILYANPRFENMFGYGPGELNGKPAHIVNASEGGKDSKDIAGQIIDNLSKHGEAEYEILNRKKDGTPFWCKAHTSTFTHPEHGKLWVAVHEDIDERKKAEEALRLNEERFRIALQATPVSVFEHDRKLRYTWVYNPNPKLGYTSDQILGKTDAELATPDRARQLTRIKRQVLKTGVGTRQIVAIPIEKETLYFDLTVEPRTDKNGRIVGLICAAYDGTEQRMTAARYRLIAETVEDVVWQLGMDLRFNYLSPAVERILGYSVEEALKLRVTDLLDPDGIQRMGQVMQSRLSHPTKRFSQPNRYKMRHKKGHMVDVEVVSSPIFDADRRPIGFAGITRNITERELMEQELQKSKTLLEEVYSSLDEAVFVLHPEKRVVVSCNLAAEKMFGYRKTEMVGRSVEFLHVSKTKYREFGQMLFAALDKQGALRCEFQLRRKDGSLFDSDHTVKEVRDKSGARRMILSIIRDISERKQYEDRLAAIIQTERASVARDLHDSVCQELASISFLADAALEAVARDLPKAKQDIGRIVDLAGKATEEAKGIARGVNPLSEEPYALTTALYDLATYVSDVYRIPCQVLVPEEVPIRSGMASTQLFLIAREAVLNAARHGSPGRIRISFAKHGRKLKLRVADDGRWLKRPKAEGKGIGLDTMKERALLIGASLRILRPNRGGTVVECVWDRNGYQRK